MDPSRVKLNASTKGATSRRRSVCSVVARPSRRNPIRPPSTGEGLEQTRKKAAAVTRAACLFFSRLCPMGPGVESVLRQWLASWSITTTSRSNMIHCMSCAAAKRMQAATSSVRPSTSSSSSCGSGT